jgi:hypothetical protein
MTLNFPNQTRSYDASRHGVRFWGYESVMECALFLTEEALKRIRPNLTLNEDGFLHAFDANRDLIYAAAVKAYARGRKGSYELVTSDF